MIFIRVIDLYTCYRYEEVTGMTDTSHTKYIFWQISSSPPRTANSIFLDLLLVLVVSRIPHVALPCELTEKTGTIVRA